MIRFRPTAWTQPQFAFAIVAFVFGTALVFIIPPFQSADEPYHFLRAYQISEGGFVARERDVRGIACAYLPASLYQVWLPFSKIGFHPDVKTSFRQIAGAMGIPLRPHERMLISFPNTAQYCPTCYMPQSFAILLGRMILLPPLALLYLGRESNLLFWIVLGFFAIRSAPEIGRPLLLLLLMPMSLYVASTVSADPSVTAVAVLFTALICKHSNGGPTSIGPGALAAFVVLSLFLSVSKFAYAPLILLLLLIPRQNFGTPRQYAVKIIFIAAICILCFAAWARISSSLDTRISMSNNVSARAQLQLLEQHPAHFSGLLMETFRRRGLTYFQSYVCVIGWFDRYLPDPFVIGYVLLLLIGCLMSSGGSLPSPMRCALVVLPAVIASFLIIALLDYLYWTPVGYSYIDGIHGRYLIPLSPAIFVLICSLTPRIRSSWRSAPILNTVAALISLGVCCYLIGVVWNRYYG